MARPLHRISCKAAIYSPDGESVLVMQLKYLGQNAFGLPGGHLEEGESPDKAVNRELYEEVGFSDVSLSRRDFWHHEDGKIILGYIGRLSTFDLPAVPNPSREAAQWVSVRAIARGDVNVGSYKEFILHSASDIASHPVSCKVAIYSPDGSHVLLMRYIERSHHGLPGGHLEKGEEPESALRRELREEIGTDIITHVEKRDFWVHHTGKVVLGFAAVASTNILPTPPHADFEVGVWVSLDALDTVDVNAYRDFIVANRPGKERTIH